MIDSPERMIETIRSFGVIPFFKNAIPGWSIEDLTDPGCWFTSSEELGPWDWKIEAVREGDIAYGKFLEGKAAFATVDWYRHLMNWRRSQAKYRVALGEKFTAKSSSEKLMKHFSPIVLSAIEEAGALEAKEIREICSAAVTPGLLKALGAKYKPLLSPAVKKNIVDSVIGFLQMGTWTVIGDFRRVYRGANLEYSGWQRASNTTPDALFGSATPDDDAPSWARHIEDCPPEGKTAADYTPAESLAILRTHLQTICGADFSKEIEKMLV